MMMNVLLTSSSSDGHVFGTTRKARWMRGAIVHVERQYHQLYPILPLDSMPYPLQTSSVPRTSAVNLSSPTVSPPSSTSPVRGSTPAPPHRTHTSLAVHSGTVASLNMTSSRSLTRPRRPPPLHSNSELRNAKLLWMA